MSPPRGPVTQVSKSHALLTQYWYMHAGVSLDNGNLQSLPETMEQLL
jgi:hypothetical protein